ncbi:MAG: amino acid ABC transporter substrate-binding protein [Anaerolineae bacterium]|nr:amino acid ABC transporter substrate-binding protein [Anaerolineae bacterium]
MPIVIFSCIFSLLVLLGCRASPDTLGRVLDAGVLRVGMDASFPPFEYVDGAGNLVGFDVDMAWEMARRMGDRLPDDREMAVQFVANLPYDGLYDALTAQRVDVVVSALYVDDARRATHAFSAPYFDAGQVLVAAGGVTGTDDLAGRTLAVEWGSEGDVTARAWERRIGDLTILPAQTAAEALAWAASGQADAALVDHLSAWGATGAGSGLRVVGEPVTSVPYAIAARIEDGRLIRYLNELLAEMEADGTLEALRVRWFR